VVAEARATFAIIAGGGTAGHVWPGLAVAKALVAAGHAPGSVHFVGSTSGIEARLVPDAGFDVTLLPGRGLQRRVTAANLRASWGLARAAARSVSLVARRRPAVVLALGGYASVPCGMAAVLRRVPLVVHEQNAVPGAANRLLARFARAAAVSFPGTDLPRPTVTGNPVRDEVLAVDRRRDRLSARQALGLPADRFVIAAFGGSLGALRINQAVWGAVPAWTGGTELAVRHVVGRRDWPAMTTEASSEQPAGLVYQPVEYEERMPLVLAAADLAVCRAGATTVAELSVVGVPSVLVPLPGAPGDHQTANARHLERAGAAVLVADRDLTPERLVEVVESLRSDGPRLEAMSRAATSCAVRDAAARVAALVEEHARRGG
jgi:undecaprenyldiphospho-muramoylpentapeptide beta-N-acetylglucosaminyltransferase